MTALPIAALLVVLTACSASGPGGTPPASSPTASTPGLAPATPTADAGTTGAPATSGPAGPTAQAVRVVLTKSGGIAGVRDTVTVEPDGRWTVADRSGASRTGRLSPADLERLRQLTADPRLAAEAAATAAPTNCADAFTYQLTVGGRTTGYVDCPTDPDRPAATAAVVELLTRATA